MKIEYQQQKLEISDDIDCPAHLIWTIITDTTLWAQWGPSVTAVESEHRYIRAKSTGKVQTAIGVWLPFTITSYKALEHWSWKVAGFRATDHSIKQLHNKHTRLTFSVPWWALPYLLICMFAIQRIRKMARAKGKDLS